MSVIHSPAWKSLVRNLGNFSLVLITYGLLVALHWRPAANVFMIVIMLFGLSVLLEKTGHGIKFVARRARALL